MSRNVFEMTTKTLKVLFFLQTITKIQYVKEKHISSSDITSVVLYLDPENITSLNFLKYTTQVSKYKKQECFGITVTQC